MSAISLQVISRTGREAAGARHKVTCVTCKLKKCVGRCRWETAPPAK